MRSRVANMAVETGRSVRNRDRHRRTPFFALALVMVACGYALTVLVFQPGYITVDGQYVYGEAKAWRLGDWQSPAMGALWRLIDPIAPGSWSMFLLTVSLYWLAFGLLALIAVRQKPWLGLLTPLVALAPPAFFFVGLIWRDVLFGVVWLSAAVLAFAGAGRSAPLRLPAQAIALVLVTFGVLLRPNAIIAAPLLAGYVIWPARLAVKRIALLFIPALAFFFLLVPAVYYGVFDAKRQNPLHSILVFDLGGVTHFTGENQFPVSWNAEQTALLRSVCYDPVRWDSYWYMPPCAFVMQRLEQPGDIVFGTPRLVAAWRRAVLAHPLAYLRHRATFMEQFLGRSNLVLPVWDWEKADATYGKSRYFQAILALHGVLQPTWLFRPGLWFALAAAVLALAWRRRDAPEGAFAVAVTASAVVYVAAFFAVGVASDFRYAYWCVLATLAGAVATVLARGVGPHSGALTRDSTVMPSSRGASAGADFRAGAPEPRPSPSPRCR